VALESKEECVLSNDAVVCYDYTGLTSVTERWIRMKRLTECHWRGKAEVLGRKPVPLSIKLPHITFGLTVENNPCVHRHYELKYHINYTYILHVD